jgi:putative transposase
VKKVPVPQVVTTLEASESPLPAQVQEALGELVGAAREGLLALSVGVGLGVVHELMELEVTEVVGPKGKHDPDRTAKRHGHEDGSMTLGGRRVPVRRPRMRTADDEHELPAKTYQYFADRDPLTRAVMDRMLAGVSTRNFAAVGEPVGETVAASSGATSKTSVSEMFVERTATALSELMGRRLDDVRLAVMMLDGMEIAERCHVVALGITTEGVKIPLGCGRAAPRTPRWPGRCWPTWSTAAWIPSRRSCSRSTAARRCGARSRACSASARSCTDVIGTRRGM